MFLLQLWLSPAEDLFIILVNVLVVVIWIEFVLKVNLVLGLVIPFDLSLAQDFLDHCNLLLNFF